MAITEEQGVQITQRVGDVIDGKEDLIIHGCNAQGAMGAGVAKAIRERLPFAYRAYRETYLLRGLTLGEVVWAIDVGSDARPRIVGNAITQENFGNGPANRQVYVDYDAMRAVMQAVDKFCARTQDGMPKKDRFTIPGLTPIHAVGMPMIGAGLAGGDWPTIAKIIEAESHHFEPVVYRLQ